MESRIMDWSKQHVIYFELNLLMRISERLMQWYIVSDEHWSSEKRERNNGEFFGF